MMRKFLLALVLACVASAASAQTCPTRPPGDSSNACASTAFTQNAASNIIGHNTAPITADGSQFRVQNSATTAENIYNPLNSAVYWDNIRCALVVPAGSTADNSSCFGSYVLNNNPLVGGRGAAVGYWGIGISAVDNAVTWAGAWQLQDSANNTPGAGVGRGLNLLEADFTIYNSGTIATGPTMLLGGPTAPSFATAFQVGGSTKWNESFVSRNGASLEALAVGATAASGTSVGSQPINFYGFNGASTLFHNSLDMTAAGNLLYTAYGVGVIHSSSGGELTSSLIANADLINPAISIGGASVALGGTATFSTIKASLSSNVTLNNISNFFDGPSIAQGTTGTWLVSGTVTLADTSGSAAFQAKLWDGTTVCDSSGNQSVGTNSITTISLSCIINSPAANMRISVRDSSSTNGAIFANATGIGNFDSTISAVRLN